MAIRDYLTNGIWIDFSFDNLIQIAYREFHEAGILPAKQRKRLMNPESLDYKHVSPENHAILFHKITQHMKEYLIYAKHKTWFGIYKFERTMYKVDKSVAFVFNIVADSHTGECKITYKHEDHPEGKLLYNLESGKSLAVNFLSVNGSRMYPRDEEFMDKIWYHLIELRRENTRLIWKIRLILAFRKLGNILMSAIFSRIATLIAGALLFLTGTIYEEWTNGHHYDSPPVKFENICINDPKCGRHNEMETINSSLNHRSKNLGSE